MGVLYVEARHDLSTQSIPPIILVTWSLDYRWVGKAAATSIQIDTVRHYWFGINSEGEDSKEELS